MLISMSQHFQSWKCQIRLCLQLFSPNSLRTAGFSLRRKEAGRDMPWPRPGACPQRVRHVSAIVLLVSALIPLWPRLHTLSAMFPPFVRIASALRALGWGVSTLVAPPNRPTLVFASSVSTICPLRPTMCPHFWTLSADGPWNHEVKFFLSIAQPAAFLLHARWSVFLAFVLVPQISAFASAPYA